MSGLSMRVGAGLGLAALAFSVLPPVSLAQAAPPKLDPAAQAAAAIAKADPASAAPNKEFTVDGSAISSKTVEMKLTGVSGDSANVNGTEVFPGSGSQIALRTTSDGFQALSVLSDASAPRETTFKFPGAKLVAGEGGVIVLLKKGKPVASIDAPWAKDATGAAVPTHYRIKGEALIQVISPNAAAVYPIVADPRVRTAWYGLSVDFTRAETKLLKTGSPGCSVVAAKVPGVVGTAIKVGCAVLKVWAQLAVDQNKCMSAKLIQPGANWVPWIAACYA